MTLQALVSTKAPDPAAVTAFGALRDRLGFAAELGGLGRATYLELKALDPLPADSPRPEDAFAKTTLLANPTKEVIRFSRDGLPIAGVGILTWWREGVVDSSLSGRIARQFPSWPRWLVLRATLWLPVFTTSTADATALATRIADAGSRTSGLLCNPHSQAMQLVEESIPPRVLFESMERIEAE